MTRMFASDWMGNRRPVRSRGKSAPLWLKAACIAGVPLLLTLLVIGVPLLFKDGPGLLVIWLGMLGLIPWVILTQRDRAQDHSSA